MGAIIPIMRKGKNAKIRLGDVLFSNTQRQVLGLLLGNPDRSYYTNEIVRFAGVGIGTVYRELEKLSTVGLLTIKKIGNQKHYQANRDCPVFEELASILRKTSEAPSVETFDSGDEDFLMIGGEVPVSRKALLGLIKRYHIRRLVLFGSAARREIEPQSDIDLMVEFEKDQAPSLGGMVTISEAFSAIFGGRKVDLVTPSILKNPYRRRAIEKDMQELYAA